MHETPRRRTSGAVAADGALAQSQVLAHALKRRQVACASAVQTGAVPVQFSCSPSSSSVVPM
eukprot:889168-Pyramimonas_sp.AAC.1